MYLRCKLQSRALNNLKLYTQKKFEGMRVTKGYVVSELLHNYPLYIGDALVLQEAIAESDMKEEGGGVAVNLNITAEANEQLEKLKSFLDKKTGRSLFPAQIVDILVLCALKSNGCPIMQDVPNQRLAKALLDCAYKLLVEETLPVNLARARTGLVQLLQENALL